MRLKIFLVLLPVVLVGGVVLILLTREPPVEEAFPDLEAILAKFSAPGRDVADPAQCIECHREITEAWMKSHHALANAPLTETDRERLLQARGPLIEEREMHWRARGPVVLLEESGLPLYPVVGSIGITPLIQYLHLAPDGRIQTQDIAWDPAREEWFSVFELEDETPRFHGEWGHWTGQGMNWDANCAYCHMTAYKKNYNVQADRYERDWDHMAITCSQCHPDMDTHLEQIRNDNKDYKETLTPRQDMESCAICHSRRDELTAHRFVAGDRYEDHFQLTLADIEGIYHPDGQVIGENYVYGSLTMSKMGHAGVTCMDCHDPHTAEFILPFDNNALCQRCHGSGLKDAPRIDPLKHSHHPAGSSGNLCVECHMPTTPFMGRDPRRDHSFSHPDPRLTLEMGVPNACSKCHNTQSVEWSLEHAEKWYGPDMNADRRKKARLLRAVWDRTEDAAGRLKEAIRAENNRFWKSTFLSLLQYTPADQEAWEILLDQLDDEDPMIRTTAIRVMGLASMDARQQEQALNDPVRSVRLAAALSVPRMDALDSGLQAELAEYLEHTSDSPMGALRLAAYRTQKGDREAAWELCQRAVRFDQYNPEAYRLAAVQLQTAGFTEDAFRMLRDGLALDPKNAYLHFNIGLLQAETGDTDKALEHLQRAVGFQPTLVDAWYNLIVLHWQVGQLPLAREKLTEALTAVPDSPRLHQLARQMPPPP